MERFSSVPRDRAVLEPGSSPVELFGPAGHRAGHVAIVGPTAGVHALLYPFWVVVRSWCRRAAIDEELEMSFMNEAGWDRIARVILGVTMLVLGWGGVVDGVVGTVFMFLGFVPLITGIVGWCPLYSIFRFRTNTDVRETASVGS